MIVRSIDLPQWWSVDLPEALRQRALTPPQSVAARGVADASLYRRAGQQAGLRDLTRFPALATSIAPEGPIRRYCEDHLTAQLCRRRPAAWQAAREVAARQGLLFMAHPMHCVVCGGTQARRSELDFANASWTEEPHALIPSAKQLSDDIRAALKADPGVGGKQAVVKSLVAKVLRDKEFVDKHLRAEDCKPRKVLFEDPELGFCVCGYVCEKPAHGAPHDHGSSWAIYGLAVGDTEMTDWRIVRKGDGETPSLVEPERTYVLKPGDAHFLRCWRRAFAAKRDGLYQAGAHRRLQPRPHQRPNIKAAAKVDA